VQSSLPKKGYMLIFWIKSGMMLPIGPFQYKVNSILNPLDVTINTLELTREAKLLTCSEEDLLEEWPKLNIPLDVKRGACIHAYMDMEMEIEGHSKYFVEIEARYIIDDDTGEVITKKFKILQTIIPADESWTNEIKNFIERYGLIVVAIVRALLESFI